MTKGRKKEELGNEGNGRQEASLGRLMGLQGVFGAARDMYQQLFQTDSRKNIKKE